MNSLNRRRFLKLGAATAAFSACPGAAFSQSIGTSAPFTDYKALVCVFLFGGNDSFNMVVPRSPDEYTIYAASRQNLAIDQNALLAINPTTFDGAQYGFHPSMGALQSLFETDRRVAIVSNVGPLIEPTTKDQILNKSVLLPPQLYSHNDQQSQWQSLKGITQSKTGWAGRIADLIRTNVVDQQMATNSSLFGNALFQSADETNAYVMGTTGPVQFEGFTGNPISAEQRLAFEKIINANYSSIYERGFAEIQQRAVAASDLVSNAVAGATVTTPFPDTQLGTQLRTVAELIDVRDQLQMQRQVFFVGAGGFDSHDNQNENQPGLLGGLSDAMAAFYDATVEIGAADMVTTFTQSDFGRTLTSNGDGTDHAWGGNHLVMGGAVIGGDMYGSFPRLEIDGSDDVGGGRMIPTTSADQYAATLAKWFDIPDAELDIVAPNLGNFAVRDLGFVL